MNHFPTKLTPSPVLREQPLWFSKWDFRRKDTLSSLESIGWRFRGAAGRGSGWVGRRQIHVDEPRYLGTPQRINLAGRSSHHARPRHTRSIRLTVFFRVVNLLDDVTSLSRILQPPCLVLCPLRPHLHMDSALSLGTLSASRPVLDAQLDMDYDNTRWITGSDVYYETLNGNLIQT